MLPVLAGEYPTKKKTKKPESSTHNTKIIKLENDSENENHKSLRRKKRKTRRRNDYDQKPKPYRKDRSGST